MIREVIQSIEKPNFNGDWGKTLKRTHDVHATLVSLFSWKEVGKIWYGVIVASSFWAAKGVVLIVLGGHSWNVVRDGYTNCILGTIVLCSVLYSLSYLSSLCTSPEILANSILGAAKRHPLGGSPASADQS